MIDHTVANGWQGLREPEPRKGENPDKVARAVDMSGPKVMKF